MDEELKELIIESVKLNPTPLMYLEKSFPGIKMGEVRDVVLRLLSDGILGVGWDGSITYYGK